MVISSTIAAAACSSGTSNGSLTLFGLFGAALKLHGIDSEQNNEEMMCRISTVSQMYRITLYCHLMFSIIVC